MNRTHLERDPAPDARGRMYAEHPDPRKSGTGIDATKYHAVRTALLAATPKSERGVSFKELPDLIVERLPGGEIPGGGSIMWYTTVVKLDLEARGLIERVKGASPQRIRRV